MFGQFILLMGIACVGAALGYMVGGSASPVVAVAVPAIFGLVVTALSLMQGAKPSSEIFDLIKALGKRADAVPEVIDFRNKARSAPARLGFSLIIFSVSFIFFATFGADARINNTLVSKPAAPTFPWAQSVTKPPNIIAALEWLALQGRLNELGYDDTRIKELYELQAQNWKALPPALQPTGNPEKTVSPGGSSLTPPVNDATVLEWLKNFNSVKGSPFANQPPQDLVDKLKGLRDPIIANTKRVPG